MKNAPALLTHFAVCQKLHLALVLNFHEESAQIVRVLWLFASHLCNGPYSAFSLMKDLSQHAVNGAPEHIHQLLNSLNPHIDSSRQRMLPGSAAGLRIDFNWLRENISALRDQLALPTMPTHTVATSGAYSDFILGHHLNDEERILLLLAMAQYLDPSLTQFLVSENNTFRLTQCSKTGVLLATGETFLKILAGFDTDHRIKAHRYFSTDHVFYRKSVIDFGEVNEGLPTWFGTLKITPSFRELFLYDRHSKPRFSSEFPAHLLETHLNWEDLVINPSTEDRLSEIRNYLDHNETLRTEWGLQKHMKDGYRCMFYGPSGTGKTLAATLLGKHVGREVYRVDISSVISKYIGETSKNLNSLFATAEDKGWILFFDEGDALFGKRVDTAEADDKNVHFANQDIAYLLQRIETYNGLVIVASNFRKNMDAAFSRRFQSIVLFDTLNYDLSKKYWESNLPEQVKLSSAVDLDVIVRRHTISPAAIMNVINRVCLRAISTNQLEISMAELELCIKDEMYK